MDARVKEVRNYLHTIPETGGHEEKTSAYLAAEIKKAGYQVETGVGGYGVVATLMGKEAGPVVGVRGDMDALVHVIDGKETAVHSCGHDAHCAMVFTMAEKIAKTGIKRGRLKIIFQPAEENLAGAKGMIEAGVVKDLDYIMGIHLRPIQEAKAGQAAAALWHGSSYQITSRIQGKTAHGARPHLGVNVIDAAIMVVNGINTIWENPLEGWSVKTTRFNSNGVIINAIPDGVNLAFDLRAQKNQVMESLVKKVTRLVNTIPGAIGAKGEVLSVDGVPAAEYDPEVTTLLEEAIVKTLGKEGLIPPIISPGADDFHFYKQAKRTLKAGFVGLGADLSPGLHDPTMSFDDSVLDTGVKILENAVNLLLN
jgi:amidohydrolase